MNNIRFITLRAAIEALALMGIHTQGDLIAAGKQLREVKHAR